MKRDLYIVNTEGNIDVLVCCVVGCLDGSDSIVGEDAVKHIVDHVIGYVLIYKHDIVNEYALHVLFVVVCIGRNRACGEERILLDQVISAFAVNRNDHHIVAECQLADGCVRKTGGNECRVALTVFHLVDRFTVG